jgi:hypothetical protein
MTKTDTQYEAGYEVGLDALKQCAALYDAGNMHRDPDAYKNISAGLLSAIISAVYYMAPNDETAFSLVMFAIDQAKGVE